MAKRDHRRRPLHQRVDRWSRRLKVRPRVVRVRRMTRKWGSCSTKGIVTLADDLAYQRPGFQDFVIAHELLHLRIPNHGKVFKALMNLHLPGWRKHDVDRRAATNHPDGRVVIRNGFGRDGTNSAKLS
jgi:predicted metal-dependent hydrolase